MSSTEVRLFDGRIVDLANYDIKGLVRLQFDEETRFAEAIKRAAPFSQERTEVARRGYALIHLLVAHRCERNGQPFLLDGESAGRSVAVAVVKRFLRADPHVKLRFFEAGFGSGAVLDAVAGFPSVEVYGCDIDCSNARKRRSQYHLFDGNAYDVLSTFADKSIKVFFWSEVIEHIPVDEIQGYLQLIYAKLSQGGYFVTIMPNWHLRPTDITQLVLPRGTEARGFHLKEYTFRELNQLLTRNGFVGATSPFCVVPRALRAILGFGHVARAWHLMKQCCEPFLAMVPFAVRVYLVQCFGFGTVIARK